MISHFHPHLRHVELSSRLFIVIFLVDTGAGKEWGIQRISRGIIYDQVIDELHMDGRTLPKTLCI